MFCLQILQPGCGNAFSQKRNSWNYKALWRGSLSKGCSDFLRLLPVSWGRDSGQAEHHPAPGGKNGEDDTASLKLNDDQNLDTKSSFVNKYICILQIYTVLPGCVSLCVYTVLCQLRGSWLFLNIFIYLKTNKTLGLSCSIWNLHHNVWDLFFFNWGMWNLVSWPGIQPGLFALGVWSLSHWTTGEVPRRSCMMILSLLALRPRSIYVWTAKADSYFVLGFMTCETSAHVISF